MRGIVLKYLKDIEQLEERILDKDKKFVDGYEKKIGDILLKKSNDFFNECEEINILCKVPKHKKLIIRLCSLYYLLDETGFRYTEKVSKNMNDDDKWKTEAQIRLFMMFVKRFHEAIYLLNAGFASASLDRVRGIYEIAVYFEIISKNNESIAEKFLKHSNTSRLEIAKFMSDNRLEKKINKEIHDLNYDYFYRKNNGWAKELFPNNVKKISFKNLVNLTQLKEYYFMYKIACLSTHATVNDSIGGIDIPNEYRGKSYWITTGSENGIEFVVKFLAVIQLIIPKYFTEANLSNIFVMTCMQILFKNN